MAVEVTNEVTIRFGPSTPERGFIWLKRAGLGIAVDGEARRVRVGIERGVPDDRERRQIDVVGRDDVGLAGGVVDHPQRSRPVTASTSTRCGTTSLGVATEHPCLGGSVDEQLVDEAPAREPGDVLEHDGRAGLRG